MNGSRASFLIVPSRFRRALIVTCSLTIVGGATIAVLVPAGLRWDFANFYDAGHKALKGETANLYDPHSLIEGREPLGHMPFKASPLSSYFYAPLALLRPGVALILFKVQNVLALFLALALLYRHTKSFLGRAEPEENFLALFAVATLLYQPFWTIFRVGGQTTPTVLLLLVVGLVWYTRGKLGAAAACVMMTVLIKPALIPALGFLGLLSGPRFAMIAGALAVGLAVLSIGFLGWEIHGEFLDLMLTEGGRSTAWVYNSAVTVWIENLRLPTDPRLQIHPRPLPLTIAVTMMQLLVLALFVRLAVLLRRYPWPSASACRHTTYLLAIVFALLILPVVWEHYLALLFPFLICLLAARHALSHGARWVLLVIFVMALGQNLMLVTWVNDLVTVDTSIEALYLGWFKSAPLLLTLLLLWRYHLRYFASHDPPPREVA